MASVSADCGDRLVSPALNGSGAAVGGWTRHRAGPHRAKAVGSMASTGPRVSRLCGLTRFDIYVIYLTHVTNRVRQA